MKVYGPFGGRRKSRCAAGCPCGRSPVGVSTTAIGIDCGGYSEAGRARRAVALTRSPRLLAAGSRWTPGDRTAPSPAHGWQHRRSAPTSCALGLACLCCLAYSLAANTTGWRRNAAHVVQFSLLVDRLDPKAGARGVEGHQPGHPARGYVPHLPQLAGGRWAVCAGRLAGVW